LQNVQVQMYTSITWHQIFIEVFTSGNNNLIFAI